MPRSSTENSVAFLYVQHAFELLSRLMESLFKSYLFCNPHTASHSRHTHARRPLRHKHICYDPFSHEIPNDDTYPLRTSSSNEDLNSATTIPLSRAGSTNTKIGNASDMSVITSRRVPAKIEIEILRHRLEIPITVMIVEGGKHTENLVIKAPAFDDISFELTPSQRSQYIFDSTSHACVVDI